MFFVLVWNLVAHLEGGMLAEGVCLFMYSFPIYIPNTLQAGAVIDIGTVKTKK
jgi:hypothetical protein